MSYTVECLDLYFELCSDLKGSHDNYKACSFGNVGGVGGGRSATNEG